MSLLSIIEENYGIKIVKTVKVRDVYKICTANGTFCLKSYAIPEEEARFIAQIFSHLDQHGFARGQRVYPTVEQFPFITYDHTQYMLTNWVNGRNPNFIKKYDFKKAIRTLAQFHSVAKGFPLLDAPIGRIRYFNLSHQISEYKDALSKFKSTKHLIPLCDKALSRLQQPKVVKAIEAEQMASVFVHGDYNYPNLIKDNQRKLHMIDFENTSLHVRMQDLSHILHRNYTWNGKVMLDWIDYYDRKRPLSDLDLNLLHCLLIAPYHVFRNLKIGGIKHAKSIIPTRAQLKKYTKELKLLI